MQNGKYEAIPFHTVYSTGSTLLNVSNLPISVTVKTTNNESFINITGRKYGVFGSMLSPPLFRKVGAYKHLTNPASGTSNPMFSIRRKAGMMYTGGHKVHSKHH
jgi:hypothetical protein